MFINPRHYNCDLFMHCVDDAVGNFFANVATCFRSRSLAKKSPVSDVHKLTKHVMRPHGDYACVWRKRLGYVLHDLRLLVLNSVLN